MNFLLRDSTGCFDGGRWLICLGMLPSPLTPALSLGERVGTFPANRLVWPVFGLRKTR